MIIFDKLESEPMVIGIPTAWKVDIGDFVWLKSGDNFVCVEITQRQGDDYAGIVEISRFGGEETLEEGDKVNFSYDNILIIDRDK